MGLIPVRAAKAVREVELAAEAGDLRDRADGQRARLEQTLRVLHPALSDEARRGYPDLLGDVDVLGPDYLDRLSEGDPLENDELNPLVYARS